MKRILVTGGAGFIGSHLCERLLERGNEVLCVDNFFTSRRQNIAHLRDNPLFEFMRHDITWPLYVEVDQIYNLACPASPVHYQFDPVQTTKTNVHGAINMLGLAKRLKVRILQASTSEVYGDPSQHPQTESYWGNVNPIGRRACYDAETEILTEDGWVPFPSLRQDTAVATLTEAGEIEYCVPDEVISYPYVGELLRFANSKYDFTVTPNHRMYVRSKTGKMRFLRADEERRWHAWKVPTGADFNGGEIEWFELGPPPPDAKIQVARIRMDDWLEFLGYYISEGCVHVRKRVREVNGRDYEVRDYNILIAQAEGDSRDCMIACLERLGFKYFSSDDHQLRICSKQLAEILAPFGKAGDKYIPREYLGLSRRQSRILLDALILGDGSRRGERVCYWTKSGRLADDVQELALRCGYAASKSLTPGRDIYRVNLRPPVEAVLVDPERIRYAGKVYCVDVKNHVICVRRQGRAAFCGNCYDEGKRCAETLFFDYYRQHKLEIRVIRIFNTYGPRMHPNDGRVVSNFIVQALKGEPITLYGTGSQSRSFCYVDDLVTGMIAMMDQDELVGPVNLGNPGEFTILELATMVKELTGSKSEIVFQPLPQDDPVRRRPDITLAKSKLHWEPTIPLRDGLTRTVEFFRELLAAEK
ncbi:MAG TPA: GDP-mannose 4,6-dehydratase [Candidatus Deferrimicrobium sp.]